MEKRILTFLAACLYYSGLVRFACWWRRRREPYLVILCYHRAQEDGELKDHLLHLRRHYRVLHLDAALDELYTPNKNRQARRDRRPLLAVTLDDGYHDNYTHGLVAASELKTPITIFLIPGYLDSGERFWWQEADYLLAHTQCSEATLEGQVYHLHNEKERAALARLINSRVRNAGSVAEREDFIRLARQALGNPTGINDAEKPGLPMNWEEVLEMDKNEWVSFGAHTVHHPILGYLTNPEEAAYEVRASRTQLEQRLGHPVRSFAYPVGWLEQAGYAGVRAAHEADFDWAVTAVYGFNTVESDPYLLRRIEVDVHEHWLMAVAKASGVWATFIGLVRTITFHRHRDFGFHQ